MQAVNLEPVDFCDQIIELVEMLRHALPVVVFLPVANQLLTVRERHALLPVFYCLSVGKARFGES